MATDATSVGLGYAFAAGVVSSINPCGFLVLPAFVAYHVGATNATHGTTGLRLARAVGAAVLASIGFMVVFGAIGLIIHAAGGGISRYFPVAGLTVGAMMVALGLWMLARNRSFGIMAATRVPPPIGPGLWRNLLFGAAYGVASLGCCLPIFLAVVVGSFSVEGIAPATGYFVSYGLGMGVVVVSLTLSAVAFRDSVSWSMRKAAPYVYRAAAVLLIGVGAYLLYYWAHYKA